MHRDRSGRTLRSTAVATLVVVAATLVVSATADAQDARFLAKEDILLYGVGLSVQPAEQTVPKDIATIVSTILVAPNNPDAQLPPFAPDAVVMATLVGPSFAAPLELVVKPNNPFNIPPLTVAGVHTLENIRLVSGHDVLLRGSPESVRINVIDKLLVTQVVARALTAAEIREKGLVFDKSSFQAYNFTAAFAIEDHSITIDFPIVLPSVQGAAGVSVSTTDIPAINPPALTGLQTIIPDTLKLQTQIPNLTVVGFTLKLRDVEGQNFIVPPIPGVIVIPGDIGFLDQVFSVMLMVSNVAPGGSNLVVSNLTASIVLPAGNDTVVGTPDDPLIMARTNAGEVPRVQPITQPGVDGKLGTADDITTLGPGETGNADFIVEGKREGSHVVEMEIAGTLNGLPVGPVAIRGRAAGAVLVRNPTFTLTFTHPDIVNAGEKYTLDVTVTNTSESPANFVSVNLFSRNLSGATLIGDASKQIDSIAPGDSSSVTFDLVAKLTGKVTAATLDSDSHIAGHFELKHSVGELGVPLSPDSLVLPRQANSLPKELRDAAIGLLGKAYAVATAPPAALPKDLQRFSKQIVWTRAVEVAEAGLRLTLHEPLRDSATQLAMDFMGSNFARLPASNPKPDDLAFAQSDFTGFDAIRRLSVRGDAFAQAIAHILADDISALGVAAFHYTAAQKIAYRPGHLSVLAGASAGPLPFTLKLLDSAGHVIGGTDAQGKVLKQIPFSDFLPFADADGHAVAQLAMIAAPQPGDFTIELDRVPGSTDDALFTLSIVVPQADGTLRQIVFDGVNAKTSPQLTFAPGAPFRLTVSMNGGAATSQPLASSGDTLVADPPPSIVGVVQQADADVLKSGDDDTAGVPVGRVIAVLFSKEVTPNSVQDKFKTEDITNYTPEANKVVSVALQPDHRIAYIALRDPVGPFMPRQIAIANVADLRGVAMLPQSAPIEMTVPDTGGVVTGRVLQADGTVIPFANVRLFYAIGEGWAGISSKSADANGAYSFDYVTNQLLDRLVGIDPETEEFRDIRFNIARNGQRLNVDMVLLGRGTFTGRTLDESKHPLRDTTVRVTSLTDQSQYGATTDANGSFAIARIPVGNILVEAVNPTANAQTFISENIPFAGATTRRDIVLLSVAHTDVTVKHGQVRGHVLRGDGVTAVGGVPVVAYYTSLGQPGVTCPGDPPAGECPVAVATTDATGGFAFANLVAGSLRFTTFDQAAYQQGEVRSVLAADGSIDINILLSTGLGTVNGLVLDPVGAPVAGARVGGGLSLATTDAAGRFTLNDVPVGRASIVAVSDTLGSRGSASVDIVRAGEVVNATIVLQSVGGVAGTVFQADGATPVPNLRVYLFEPGPDNTINVVGVATTDGGGHYSMPHIPIGEYTASAFKPDFSDGNIKRAAIRFFNEVVKTDIVFRGAGGRVTGTVFDDDGVTPLKARVGVSGDRLVIAGGQVGTGFTFVQNFAIVDTDFSSGKYAVSGLWVGPFSIRAAGQFSPDPITLEGNMPSPGATVQMDLRLQATSQVAGTVFLPDGVTAAGANLVVRYKSNEFKVICTTSPDGDDECTTIPQGIQEEVVVTDDHGRFLLPLVNAGTFTITVDDQATGKTGQIHGAVKAGEKVDLTVRLAGLGEITVQVIGSDARTAIPGAKVEVSQLDFPGKKATVFADAQGAVVLGGGDSFTEGAFVVLATDVRNGFAGRATGKIVQDGDRILVKVFIYNASGTVSGTVFRSDALTPVPNADVVISNEAGPLAFSVTDASGAFSQPMIPLGEFTVDIFEAATARRAFASGRIDFNGEQVPVTINEAALGVVRGTVLETGPKTPLKGWEVSVSQTAPGGRGLPSLRTMSSVDGTFSVPGVSQGPFRVSAHKSDVNGSGSAALSIEREGQVVDIPLLVNIVRPLFGNIDGRAFNPDGSPAANSPIDVCDASCLDFDSGVHTTAGADGAFFVPQVRLGRFQVRARSQVSRNVGTAAGQVSFDGETAGVTVVMVGISTVSGTVFRGDGTTPAAGAQVVLTGSPDSGCGVYCIGFADANGHFTFENVAARTFTIEATDPVSGLKGVIGDILNPGELKQVRIVLEPTGSLRARMLTAGGPTSGVVGELVMGSRRLFVQSKNDGTLTFATTPIGQFTLSLTDAVGAGVATRNGIISGNLDLGDVILDEAPPLVSSTNPAAAATGVPLATTVQVVFSEQVDASTINASNLVLSDGTSVVTTSLLLTGGDTRVTVRPVAPLRESTRYTLRVANVKDLVGKPMPATYTASFTTVDLTPPSLVQADPARQSSGVPIYSVVRLQFSEQIDPTKFGGTAPIQLTGPAGAIQGRTDFSFSNTVIIFTPARPLDENTAYSVHAGAATDLSGNAQPQTTDYTFSTTSRIPPAILSLTADNNGRVIENTNSTVLANVGTANDVSFVDFSINDVFAFTSRSTPFHISFKATPTYGRPGDVVRVSAVATDTSGNRGMTAVSTSVLVIPDQLPAVVINSPAEGVSARNGDRINVSVAVTDDVAIAQLGFKPDTGHPQDAKTILPTAPAEDLGRAYTTTFGFNVPNDATPGSSITIDASAADSKGQIAHATPIHVTVLDAVPPSVTINGATTGDKIKPGQSATAIVSTQDRGGVKSIVFSVSGVSTFTATRTLDPAQPAAVASFTFAVPSTATAGQSATLHATAIDAAGNLGTAADVILLVADSTPPVLHLRAESGSLEIVPGQSVNVVADASDETAVASIDLNGSGAFIVNQSKQVTPPTGNAHVVFTILVPANAVSGTTLNLLGKAIDLSGNVSQLTVLTFTVKPTAALTLPSSVLLNAGTSQNITLQVSPAAPAGGLRVDLASANTSVATVTPFVVFAQGESSKFVSVAGVSGGTVTVSALVNAVQLASTIVTVEGGLVDGTVFDSQLNPVAGAQVTVNGGFDVAAVTDASGRFSVAGVPGPVVTVKALDPQSSRRGFASGTMAIQNGFVHINVVLIQAGLIHGAVFQTDGQTSAGAGVKVDIFARSDLNSPLATTFTDAQGQYEFPLVTLGDYTIDATATNGSRGRSSATIGTSGQSLTVPIVFLGQGSVAGTVFDASNNPVGNASLTFTTSSIFGSSVITHSANADGTFRFDNVPVGTFTLVASDPVTSRAATVNGTVSSNQQVVTVNLHLATYGGVQGVVRRADGVTTVANAQMLASTGARTTTDSQGRYTFDFLPLGQVTVTASDPATRGVGYASTTLTVNAQLAPLDVQLLPQGSVLVTVTDANGARVPNASVGVDATGNIFSDHINGRTGADGTVVIDHVLAGTIRVSASSGGLSGSSPLLQLAGGELKAVTVALQPTASVTGHVFLPDGQSPATSGTVQVGQLTYYGFQAVASVPVTDGLYAIGGLTLGTYSVRMLDANSRPRALARNAAVLTANGQVATVDLTEVGLGILTGRVVNPDGSSAQNMGVQVHDLNADFGGFGSATTNAGGFYEIDNLAVGRLVITTGDASQGLLGEAVQEITEDGQTVNADVLLQSNAVNPPLYFYDASNYLFDLQPDGSIRSGASSGYYGQDAQGASVLDVTVAGATTLFSGANIGTIRNGGRELVVQQQNVAAGIDVTRRIFVPREGYFARYVDILSNPTANPVTLDLRVQNHIRNNYYPFGSGTPPTIVSTSSGDTVLDVSNQTTADRFVVVDDADSDPFVLFNNPAQAWVFDGNLAADHVASAAFTQTFYCPYYCYATNHLTYRWNQVTVPAGGKVAYLHFVVQQTSRASVLASAQRLEQLPPEALDGLSPDDIAAIRNFLVPADGVGPVASLPSLNGTVTGQVFELDGATPVVFTPVQFKSANPFFARAFTTYTDAGGQFTFASTFNDYGGSLPIPVDNFTLTATHPGTNALSGATAGSFVAGQALAVQNVVFSNLGTVAGRVRRHTGDLVSTGSVQLSGTNINTYTSVEGDGSYQFTGVPAGTFALTATLPHPQGTALVGAAQATVIAGSVTTADVTIQPTGAVAGTLFDGTGSFAPNVGVYLQVPGFYRYTVSDTAGNFAFTDVPEGAGYTVYASDPRSGIQVSAPVSVQRDVTTTQNLTLVGLGTLDVLVLRPSGAVVPNALVYVQQAARGGGFFFYGRTDSGGHLLAENIASGAFTAKASDPNDFDGTLSSQTTGTLVTNQTLPVTVTLPGTGTITGTLRFPDGTPAQRAEIDLREGNAFRNYTSTDTSGAFAFPSVPLNRTFTVRGFNPNNSTYFKDSGAITFTADGQVAQVNLTLPVFASVQVTVLRGNHTPFAGARVQLRDAFQSSFRPVVVADANGVALFQNVPEGSFTVQVTDPSTGRIVASVLGIVRPTDQGSTVAITVVAGVSLPMNLFDGNNLKYDIQTDGDLSDGQSDAYDGAFFLRLFQSGSQLNFNGASAGTLEDNDREVGISQQNLAGLNVTRKIFVAPDGYFGRYLELLNNPSAAPITVDVQIQTNLGSDSSTRIIATSGGDKTFGTDDYWLVHDDDDGSRPYPQSDPTTAEVVGGPGARAQLSQATLAPNFSDNLIYRWNSITVPPGQTVILMHFAVQNPNQTGATAAVQRLVQLPPESIAGLSADERAQILNFNVPADGSSPVPPLPARNATVTGQVLSGDQTTPISSAQVTLQSAGVPIFAGGLTTTSAADGSFTFNNVPAIDFTLTAQNPIVPGQTFSANGQFGAGQTSALQNVVFTGTGSIRGIVHRGATAVSNGNVQLFDANTGLAASATIRSDGSYVFGGLAPGTYSARAAVGTAGGATANIVVSANQLTTADIAVGLGTVSGTIFFASGAPAPGAVVYLLDAATSSFLNVAYTNSSGGYTFPLQLAQAARIQVYHPTNPYIAPQFSGAVTITTDAQVLPLNLTLPPSASVLVTVLQPDGTTPIAGAQVYIQRPTDSLRFEGTTNASGVFTITNVPEGASTVQVYDSIGLVGSATVTVTSANDGGTLSVTITAPIAGVVQGTIYAADGMTPIGDGYSAAVNVSIQAVDNATGQTLANVSARGPYSAGPFAAGAQGFTVRLVRSADGAILAEQPGSFTSRGQQLTMNFTVAVPVVKGHVTFADGSPVRFPDVFVKQTGADTIERTFFAVVSDNAGAYAVVGQDAGAVTVFAQDSETGLTAMRTASIASATDVVTVDLHLPATATVQGTVFDAANTPVQFGEVSLTSPQLSGYPFAATDGQGHYQFTTAPIGPITLQACAWIYDAITDSSAFVCRTVTTTLGGAGSTVNIVLPVAARVAGNVFDVDGVTPVADASVTVENADSSGPLSTEQRVSAVTDGIGHYRADGVQVGNVTVTAFANGVGGRSAAQLTPAGATVNVTLSDFVRIGFAYDLRGTDGFAYSVGCSGDLVNGEDSSHAPYDDAYSLDLAFGSVSGTGMTCAYAAELVAGGRQLVIGPSPIGVMKVTRKVFVPADGGFARYLEVLSNSTDTDVTLTARVTGSDGNTRLVVAPANTSDAYAVNDDPLGRVPSLGFVFAGPGGATGASSIHFVSGDRRFSYAWQTTVPAHQTRIMMHFAIQRAPLDTAGAQSQASALAGLSDPSALVGMSTDEKAQVVNFNVPH